MYLVSTGDLCKIASITRMTLYQRVASGRMSPPVNVGKGNERPRYMWDLEVYCERNGLNFEKSKRKICSTGRKN